MTGTVAGPDAEARSRIVGLLRSGDAEALGALYLPDALFDAHVPEWRFQLQGPAAITARLREEWAVPGREVLAARPLDTVDGVVVELLTRFVRDGQVCQFEEVHLVHLLEGRIAEHAIYCTGVWDPGTIARQAVEAPMVRSAVARP